MPRPKPDPHPIEPFLASKGLRPLSISNYAGIARRIDAAGRDAEGWLASRVTSTTPKRTLSVYRSAVAYYLEWTKQTSRADANAVLPSLRPQPEGHVREALTKEQLAAYYVAAEKTEEPYRTILLLLPRTGLRIFEMCAVSDENCDLNAKELRVIGKRGRARRVPLSTVAARILQRHLDRAGSRPGPQLFWTEGLTPRPVTMRDVRRVTKALALANPDTLWNLSPHVLRHTLATALLEDDVDLKTIQDILGHKTIKSLEPYLHATAERKRAALERFG